MTEQELAAIEERLDELYGDDEIRGSVVWRVLDTDVPALVAEVRRVRAQRGTCPACGTAVSCPCGFGIGS